MNAKMLLLANLVVVVCSSLLNADLVYESATGNSNVVDGVYVGNSSSDKDRPPQLLGSRFTLAAATEITSVGGAFGGVSSLGRSADIFAAIVDLNGGSLPSGAPLGMANVLGTATFFASHVGDTLVPLNLQLTPGDYALVFGGGVFGTDGVDSMTPDGTNTVDGQGSYFFSNNGKNWVNGGVDNVRFVVNGVTVVPEPGTLCTFGFAAFCSLGFRRRNSRSE